MEVIIVQNAIAGMILAADVLDFRGRVMISNGTSLSEKDLERLRRWGVKDIKIQGKEYGGPSTRSMIAPSTLRRKLDRLQASLALHEGQAVMELLLNAEMLLLRSMLQEQGEEDAEGQVL